VQFFSGNSQPLPKFTFLYAPPFALQVTIYISPSVPIQLLAATQNEDVLFVRSFSQVHKKPTAAILKNRSFCRENINRRSCLS